MHSLLIRYIIIFVKKIIYSNDYTNWKLHLFKKEVNTEITCATGQPILC